MSKQNFSNMRCIWESIANILIISSMYFSLYIPIKYLRESSKFPMPACFSMLHKIVLSINFKQSLTDFVSLYYIEKQYSHVVIYLGSIWPISLGSSHLISPHVDQLKLPFFSLNFININQNNIDEIYYQDYYKSHICNL